MPRRSRMCLPNDTYHIVQRGNNREACFFENTLSLIVLNDLYLYCTATCRMV
jgi:putative transposase